MVSNESLKKQIANQRKKIAIAKKRNEDELENIRLQQELKVLQRSPTTRRNIEFTRRTGRGLKKVSEKAGKFLVKQGKLIREQGLRDEASREQRFLESAKIKKRALKKSRKKIKKRVQETASVSDSIFGDLNF